MKNKKIKIAFVAPMTKGGPYHVYKELVAGLKEKYSDELDVYFFNCKVDWLKLHFGQFDYIFSVIPFLFKPIGCGKYIFNPRGNFELEKKKNNLGNKLLYLANNNLKFADNIWLVSYFLADKLNFREKYNDKILIFPNFIDINKYKFPEKQYDNDKFKILTITSFKFYDKGKGILNLGNVISKLGNKTIRDMEWTIVGNDHSENFKKIKTEFDEMSFRKNINIVWKGWIDKDQIIKEFKNNDYFLYWTYLDNFPGVLLEAIACKMKVLVNDFESFKYFLDGEMICESEDEMVNSLLEYKKDQPNISQFNKDFIINSIFNFIK